jgi:hypothetical protein
MEMGFIEKFHCLKSEVTESHEAIVSKLLQHETD